MNNLDKLRQIKRATTTFADAGVVTKETLLKADGHSLPLLIQPKYRGVNLVSWIKENRKEFDNDLIKHGGLLLRGFNIKNLEDFGLFVNSFQSKPLKYMFRSSPRHELNEQVKNVYNSTIYPKKESINLHNESSYARNWGAKIVFCCLLPAEHGGETPIADSRKILKDISPQLVSKFHEKGVLYRRRLIDTIGMSWKEVFQTADKKVVETVCNQNKIKHNFVNEKHLTIEWNKKAIYKHPVSQEETWFNHIYFFNKYSRYAELGMDPKEHFSSDLIHSDTLFGDGTEISYQEYVEIKNAYDKNTLSFPYEKGDILFLDNMLTAHGRNPYKGNRLIATAILDPIADY